MFITNQKTLITEIKATVPGAGKTTLACRAFKKLIESDKKQNLIFLTPSNKNRQNIIQMLRNMGVENAEKYVKTVRGFKQNYKRWRTFTRVYDDEAMEYVEKTSGTQYITTESKFHYKKTWDHIFIDEAGQVSNKDMKDLEKHWKIKHLNLIGDTNQFSPIPNIQKLDDGDSPVNDSVWIDDGSFYDVPVDYQFVLNKSMRSKDERLSELIELMKNGHLSTVLQNIQSKGDDDKLSEEDWNIAYTNAKCEKINKLYEEKGLVSRYIIIENDKKHGFSKSEILDVDDYRFEKLKNDLAVEDGLDWEEWQKYYIRPAMCITAHKLQGFTVPGYAHVKIHLDDIIEGVYGRAGELGLNREKIIETIQKFLYVAISRAQRYDQVQVFWNNKDDFIGGLISWISHPNYVENDEDYYTHIKNMLENVESQMKPLVDEQLQDDPYWTGASDDEDVLEKLMEVLTIETEAPELEGEKEFWQKYSEDRKTEYAEDDVNYAKTHTYKECKKNKGWAETKVRNMRRSQVDPVKNDNNKTFHLNNLEEPETTNLNTFTSENRSFDSIDREIEALKAKIALLERQKQR